MKLSVYPLALMLAACGFQDPPSLAVDENTGSKPTRVESVIRELEPTPRYLAFQIFTWGPDPRMAGFRIEGTTLPKRQALVPYIQDIKTRIGAVGDGRNHLGFVLGPISCFDQSDADVTQFIKLGFDLALETNVAVGFKIDDSMFWANRKDLWSDPKNVEASDWKGTPSTGRRLDWGTTPTEAPPQMCFNSPMIQKEVQHRSAILGKAIHAGIERLKSRHRPELFVGITAGWETMIGQDFATGKYLGYRALMNRGFSSQHLPKNKDVELASVVKEFIDLWSKGFAEAGVPVEKIYSHTAFLSHRVFNLSDHGSQSYHQYNHFAPPSVAFGDDHQPGFSTYPQPGLFDEIYGELAKHRQRGWSSSEGTNLQLGAGPGHSGMNMETYLAKMFNHGATLVDIFSWGIGGEANRNNEFRQVTESDEALNAYRKFLTGGLLTESNTDAPTLLERLPSKIHKIQNELPAWLEKTRRQAEAQPLMIELDSALKVKNFDRAEKAADAVLKLIGGGEPSTGLEVTDEIRKKLRHEFGFSFLVYRDKIQAGLSLISEQKLLLDKYLAQVAPSDLAFFQSNESQAGGFDAFRTKAFNGLDSELKKILTDAQRARLSELVRQREGLFGGPSLWTEMQITDDEKTQFRVIIEPMSKKMAFAAAKAQHQTNPAEVQREVLGLRADLERQLEAVLTDSQRKRWKESLGKPVPVSFLFDVNIE